MEGNLIPRGFSLVPDDSRDNLLQVANVSGTLLWSDCLPELLDAMYQLLLVGRFDS